MAMREVRRKTKWYEAYLPFVAKSPEMQVDWLVQVLHKGTLTLHEIAPYVRLLLETEDPVVKARLAELVNALEAETIEKLLAAADVYDVPKIFALVGAPTVFQAIIAMVKEPPPYEKTPHLVMNRVFQAIHAKSPLLLQDAAAGLRQGGAVSPSFEEAYGRFLELLEDEKLLSTLYPKAKVDMDLDLF